MKSFGRMHAHREEGGGADAVVGLQFARLEDDLERRLAAGLDDGGDLVLHARVFAGEERAAVDHHVDLVGAVGDRLPHLGEARLAAAPVPTGTRSRRRRCARSCRRGACAACFTIDGIDADGGDRRNVRVVVRSHSLPAKRRDLPGRVLALERGEVDHRDRELQTEDLRRLLDAAGREFGDALLDADGVDRADFIEQSVKCGLHLCEGVSNLSRNKPGQVGLDPVKIVSNRRAGRYRG